MYAIPKTGSMMKNSFGFCLCTPRNQVPSTSSTKYYGRVIIIIMEKYVEWINASIFKLHCILSSAFFIVRNFFCCLFYEKYELVFVPPPTILPFHWKYYRNHQRGQKKHFSTLWRIESLHPGYVYEIVMFDVRCSLFDDDNANGI